MKAPQRYTLWLIPALQLIMLIILLLLEYLSGYKAGVMQHLYIQKISLYNQIYEGRFFMHCATLVLCIGLGLIITQKGKQRSFYIVDKLIMIGYAGLWALIAVCSNCPQQWPPHSHFLIFFELACLSQLLCIILKNHWK